MVPQIKPPCGGCDHRKVGCHGRCEEYRGYVSAVEAYKARREALQHLQVETGSLACLGCGMEHSCGVHGCAILREAVKLLSVYVGTGQTSGETYHAGG